MATVEAEQVWRAVLDEVRRHSASFVAFMIAHNIYAYRLLQNGQEGGFWPGDRQ